MNTPSNKVMEKKITKILETQTEYCPQCKKETIQISALYDPDNPEAGEVWECTQCHESISIKS